MWQLRTEVPEQKEMYWMPSVNNGHRQQMLSMPAGQSRCWRAIKAYAEEKEIECWISMEEQYGLWNRSLFSLRVPV